MEKFSLLVLIVGEDSKLLQTPQEYFNFKKQYALEDATLVLIFAGKRVNRIIAGQQIGEIDALPIFDDSQGVSDITHAIQKWTYEAQVNMCSGSEKVKTGIFVDVSDKISEINKINSSSIMGGFDKTEYFQATECDGERAFQHISVSSIDQLESLAKTGDAVALYKLGLSYLNGERVEKDALRAQRILKQAVLRGNTDALYAMIDYFEQPGDYICESAAELGYAKAQWLTGKNHYTNYICKIGTDTDLEKASYWLGKAKEQGYQEAEELMKKILLLQKV